MRWRMPGDFYGVRIYFAGAEKSKTKYTQTYMDSLRVQAYFEAKARNGNISCHCVSPTQAIGKTVQSVVCCPGMMVRFDPVARR